MSELATPVTIGVDVDSRYLQIARHDASQVERIDNAPKAIGDWLRRLSGPVVLAVEATGCYHFELVDRAHAAGVPIYLIDPYRLSRYRDGVGERNKTDQVDALLLARYLAHERAKLRAYQPPSAAHRHAWILLKRRAAVVKAEGIITESLQVMSGLGPQVKALKRRFAALKRAMELALIKQLQRLGLESQYDRCRGIYGVGKLTAAALVLAFERGTFTRADAFVAYLGLDIRMRRSGTYKGREKLTKKGDSECRRLLFNAAKAAARKDQKAYYERLRARGLAPTQGHVAVARKLVRTAFALMKNQQDYDPGKVKMA